ncbi:MAG: taurine catabolism dioxygenase TauD [Myxococcales bacterium]|nr:taurine catabolism dioxygenase TauD [Myxococcales bacterium]
MSDDYRIEPLDARGLPLVVRPGSDASIPGLVAWLRERPDWVAERMVEHGALLFRGFAVSDGEDFEQVARAIDPELANEYLGTSPRDAVTKSGYVFSASELPPFFPIPQHCEMSFTANPPRRVFFCALRPSDGGGGETPLCDFRKVWRDLDPAVKQRFETGGLRIVRNYSGPSGGSRFDLWKLKPWHEMFLTTDRAAVEARCKEQGFEPEWIGEDGLRLISTQPVVRDHPVTGEPVWHNHATTFHGSQAAGEYAHIHALRPSLGTFALRQLARVLTRLQRRKPVDERAMECTYRDGREIPDADMDHVRDVVWRHMVIEPWQRGDVVAIDNHGTSHGRLPYRGPRSVAVCWA